MIKLEMTGICAGCEEAELTLKDSWNSIQRGWDVLCEHEDACKRIKRMKKEEERKE